MTRFVLYAIGFLLLDLVPIHAVSIRGRVTSVDFPGGVPGVYVNVYQDTTATRWGATADSSGQFLITSLPAGTYQLHCGFSVMLIIRIGGWLRDRGRR